MPLKPAAAVKLAVIVNRAVLVYVKVNPVMATSPALVMVKNCTSDDPPAVAEKLKLSGAVFKVPAAKVLTVPEIGIIVDAVAPSTLVV